MTVSRAEKIVGFPFEVVLSPARTPLPNGTKPLRPVWICTGKHNVYGYRVEVWHEQQRLALKMFVDANYREISHIVCREQNHRCMGCGHFMYGKLTIDHIQMRSHTRIDTRDNLRALCVAPAFGGNECHYNRHHVTGWKPEYTLEDLSKVGQVEV